MPDRRRSRRELTPPPLDPRREAGERLKRAIHVARAKRGLTSDSALSLESGIAYDTLYNWYSGRTTPRGKELRQMAAYLDVPYAELEAVYNGTDPEPPPLVESVRALVEKLDYLIAEMKMDRAAQTVLIELAADVLRRQVPPSAVDAQMDEARRRAGHLSRESSGPRPRARPQGGR